MNHIKNQLLLDLLLQQVQVFGNVLTEVSPHAKQMLGDWGRNLQTALSQLSLQTNNDILIGAGPRGQALASLNMAQVAAGKRPYVSEDVMRRRLPQIIDPPRSGPWANFSDEEWQAVRPTLLDPANGLLFTEAFNNHQYQQSQKALNRLMGSHKLLSGELEPWTAWTARKGVHDQPLDLMGFNGKESAGLYSGLNIKVVADEMTYGKENGLFLLLPLQSNDQTFLLATHREIRFLTRVMLEDTWSLHNRCEFANADMVRAAVEEWLGPDHCTEVYLQGMLNNVREELDAIPPMSLEDWAGLLKRSAANLGNQLTFSADGYSLSLSNYFVQLRLTMNSMPPSDAPGGEILADHPTHIVKGGLELRMLRPPHAQTERAPGWDELPLRTRGAIASDLFGLACMARTLMEPEITALKAAQEAAAKKVAKKAVKKAPAKKAAVKKSTSSKGR